MTTIATMILAKYNGDENIPFPPASSARKPKRQPAPPVVMTEGMLKNKEMLRNTLRCGIWTIEFTKVDGTPAIMECTLDPKFLPPSDGNSPNKVYAEVEHLLRVYATDRQGWRSFVVPNVTRIYKKIESL